MTFQKPLFVTFLASCALHATPFVSCSVSTPTQTTTVTGSSFCNLGNPSPPFAGTVQAMAQAGDSISGLQGMMGAETSAGIFPVLEGGPGTGYGASAQASDSVEYATSGSARPGFIQFNVNLYLFRGAPADAVLSDGVHQYSYANETGSTPGTCTFGTTCVYTATLPFDLGTTFSVSVLGNAGITSPTFGGGEANGGAANVDFTLLEADGATPVSFFVVPEPATAGILFIALAALI